MKLYLTNINEITMEHMPLISPERAKKASRYRFPADKKRCIAGGLLLRRFLGDNAIFTDEFGKPRAESGVCFNLSHSGDWVMLAVGEKEIGCDIEQLRQTDALRMGRVVYTDAELELLRGSRDRLGCFYALWTKKKPCSNAWARAFTARQKRLMCAPTAFARTALPITCKQRRSRTIRFPSVCAAARRIRKRSLYIFRCYKLQ